MARRKSTTGEENPAAPASFEQALATLETIVEAMEHEQLPLEQLVASYEEGARLLHHCESILNSARQRIELITLRNHEPNTPAAAPETRPDHDEDFPEPSGPADATDNDDDDIRLF